MMILQRTRSPLPRRLPQSPLRRLLRRRAHLMRNLMVIALRTSPLLRRLPQQRRPLALMTKMKTKRRKTPKRLRRTTTVLMVRRRRLSSSLETSPSPQLRAQSDQLSLSSVRLPTSRCLLTPWADLRASLSFSMPTTRMPRRLAIP